MCVGEEYLMAKEDIQFVKKRKNEYELRPANKIT